MVRPELFHSQLKRGILDMFLGSCVVSQGASSKDSGQSVEALDL